MNIFKILFELFVIYILYKFIFEFIIPIFNTTRQVKQKMNEMHQQMQQKEKNHINKQYTTTESSASTKKPAREDYIDYEEIK